MKSNQQDLTLLPINTHPYAVELRLILGSNIKLDSDAEQIQLPFSNGVILKMRQMPVLPSEQGRGIKRIQVELEAFQTPEEAQIAGKQFVAAMFWVAISKQITIGVEKLGDITFSVLRRVSTISVTARGELSVYYGIKPEEFVQTAKTAFESDLEIPNNVLSSMEFFASARMEITERARFIALMTALEALAVQKSYGIEVEKLLKDLARQLEGSPIFEDAVVPNEGEDLQTVNLERREIKTSLSGRIRDLKRESVRRAIRREVDQLNESGISEWIDEVYDKRSKLVHEGLEIPNLSEITHQLEQVLRKIYARRLGLALERA